MAPAQSASTTPNPYAFDQEHSISRSHPKVGHSFRAVHVAWCGVQRCDSRFIWLYLHPQRSFGGRTVSLDDSRPVGLDDTRPVGLDNMDVSLDTRLQSAPWSSRRPTRGPDEYSVVIHDGPVGLSLLDEYGFALVVEVREGSQAARGGAMADSWITAVDGEAVCYDQALAVFRGWPRPFTMTFRRQLTFNLPRGVLM